MSFITKTHLSRRTFLHGVGVTMALPLLESMIPAATAFGQTAARPRTRLGAIYFPHGAIMPKWTPATEGAGYELTEILHADQTVLRPGQRHQRSAARARLRQWRHGKSQSGCRRIPQRRIR